MFTLIVLLFSLKMTGKKSYGTKQGGTKTLTRGEISNRGVG